MARPMDHGAQTTPRTVLSLSFVLALLVPIFVLDVLTPLGIAVWALYVLPVWMASRTAHGRRHTLLVAGLVTVLTLVGYLASPAGPMSHAPLVNRALAVVIIWVNVLTVLVWLRRDALLTDSQQRAALALEAAEFGPWEIDLVTGRATGSDEVRRMLGFSHEEEPRTREEWLRHVVEEDRATLDFAFTEALARTDRYDVEYRVQPPGEPIRWVLSRARVLRNRSGMPARLVGVAGDVTPRKAADASARAREEEYRTLFESAGVGHAEYEAHTGGLTRVNPKFCDITGYRASDLLTMTMAELVHPEDGVRIASLRESVPGAATSESTVELRVRRAGGGVALALVTTRLLPPAHDRPWRFLATVLDVTNRRIAEAAARETEERFRLLVEGVQDYAIFMLDPDGRIITWNAGAERIKGYRADEIIGHHFSELYDPEGRAANRPKAALEDARRHGRHVEEGWRMRKDGSRFWASVTLTAMRGHDGNLRGFSKVTRDLTERRQAEEALKLNARLLEQSNLLVCDLDNRIVMWNRGAEQLYGYTCREAVGRLAHELLRTVFPRPLADIRRQLIDHGFWAGELTHTRKDGAKILVASQWTAHYEGDRLAYVIEANTDITRRREAEESLRELTRSLEERVRQRTAELQETNIALEAFSYSVSHDLRAPLRTMQGFAHALLEDYATELPEEGRHFADRIAAGAERMDRLIQDLLAYSRLSRTTIQSKDVDLDLVFQDVRMHLRSVLEESGAELRILRPLGHACGHRATLVQVLSNLVSNAAKFTQRGAEPAMEVWAERRDGWVRLWVADHGIGIAPEHHERIFQASSASTAWITTSEPGSAWPSCGVPWSGWGGATASNRRSGRAAGFGSNCLRPRREPPRGGLAHRRQRRRRRLGPARLSQVSGGESLARGC